ncbi:MAG: hypothetical protein ABF893_09480 [Gluconacetobacter liquefaciens]
MDWQVTASGNRRLRLQTRSGQDALPKLLFRIFDFFLIFERLRIFFENEKRMLPAY